MPELALVGARKRERARPPTSLRAHGCNGFLARAVEQVGDIPSQRESVHYTRRVFLCPLLVRLEFKFYLLS